MKYSKHGEGVVVRKIQQDINYTVELLFNLIDYIKKICSFSYSASTLWSISPGFEQHKLFQDFAKIDLPFKFYSE